MRSDKREKTVASQLWMSTLIFIHENLMVCSGAMLQGMLPGHKKNITTPIPQHTEYFGVNPLGLHKHAN